MERQQQINSDIWSDQLIQEYQNYIFLDDRTIWSLRHKKRMMKYRDGFGYDFYELWNKNTKKQIRVHRPVKKMSINNKSTI